MNPDIVFVYGSLRKGMGNHRLLVHPDVEYIGNGTIKGTIFSLGGFPGVHVNGDTPIVGEMYRVTSPHVWTALDRLEGHPTFYKREEYVVHTDKEAGTEVVTAWTYIYQGPSKEPIEHGDWVKYSKERRHDVC